MNLLYKWSVCLFFSMLLVSQKTWSQNALSVGPNISAGSKGFPVNGNGGLGASLEYVRTISKTGGLRLYLGYDWFQRRFPNVSWQVIQDSIAHMGIDGHDLSFIPLRAGYQYFFIPNALFIYGEAGASHILSNYVNPSISRNCFSYAIGTGYKLEIGKMQYLQASIYYNHNRLHEYIKRNYFSLRLAYGLSNL